jgi:hypothetical protein
VLLLGVSMCVQDVLAVLRGAAPLHGGPWPWEVFEDAVLATLHPDQGRPSDLRGATAHHTTMITPADCHAALHQVERQLMLPHCEMNKCRWYHLNKALSVPPPQAPEVISRTQTSVTLRLHG